MRRPPPAPSSKPPSGDFMSLRRARVATQVSCEWEQVRNLIGHNANANANACAVNAVDSAARAIETVATATSAANHSVRRASSGAFDAVKKSWTASIAVMDSAKGGAGATAATAAHQLPSLQLQDLPLNTSAKRAGSAASKALVGRCSTFGDLRTGESVEDISVADQYQSSTNPARIRGTSHDYDGSSTAANIYHHQLARVDALTSKTVAKCVERLARPQVVKIFQSVEQTIIDEMYMPSYLAEGIKQVFADQAEATILRVGEAAEQAVSYQHKRAHVRTMKRFITQGRISKIDCKKHTYHALRSMVLYLLFPADETFWYIVRRPTTWMMAGTLIIPWAGFGVWVMCFMFSLIDRRDEFQLVLFIVLFRLVELIWSLWPASSLWLTVLACLNDLNSSFAADEPPDLSSCDTYVPGTLVGQGATYDPVKIASECSTIVRQLLFWTAFFLLLRGDRHGGPEQLVTIEQIRIDASDGELDGKVDVKRAQAWMQDASAPSLMARKSQAAKLGATYREAYKHNRDLAEEACIKRTGWPLPRRDGGPLMKLLFLYELAVLIALVISASAFLYSTGNTLDDWMTWLVIEMCKITHAAASVPYLLFVFLPVEALTGTSATAYDRQGWLCQQLQLEDIRECRAAHEKLKRAAAGEQMGNFRRGSREHLSTSAAGALSGLGMKRGHTRQPSQTSRADRSPTRIHVPNSSNI